MFIKAVGFLGEKIVSLKRGEEMGLKVGDYVLLTSTV